MRQLWLLISPALAVLLFAGVRAQNPVEIQFQTDPILSQTGSEIVFTVLTVSEVLSITWKYKEVTTVGIWAGGTAVVNPEPQFLGRVTITATQLRIGGAQLRDEGNYTAEVTPSAPTGLSPNSRSIQLRVFDAVAGVSLSVPAVAVEERNVSLSCTWTAGTEITVQWGKGGSAITADSRITISGGSLVINPARRTDAGEYTCTASNPVSAQTATQSLTVYYGPDTPVLTVDSPKDCVGAGDVLVGQTVRLTCTSDSAPPALFSWQRDGQPIASGQPDSGVLSLQTFSTTESGRYVCAARNAITEKASEQSTELAVVDVCLDGGEIAGIVIGSFLGIVIIVILIVLLIFLARRRRGQEPKTNPSQRPIPPDPQATAVRDVDQGFQPPLYHRSAHPRQPDRWSTSHRESHGNPQYQPLNEPHNSNTQQHNGHGTTNRPQHNTIQNMNSSPHNGIDNPAFMQTDAQNTNTQQRNPNILIQTGNSQGGARPPALQVSLNALPYATQPNNNAQMPTIHVNLNSYSTGGQQPQQDGSFPLTNLVDNTASQMQHTRPSEPAMQSGQSYPSNPLQNGIIPTGYTHSNNNITSQRNANTQTYQRDQGPHFRPERNSTREDASSSSHGQRPWDQLRGTPAYPSGNLQRGQTSPGIKDYTTQPPVREARAMNTPQSQSQTVSRRRTPPRRDPASDNSQTRSHSAHIQLPNATSVTQLEPLHHTLRSPRTQRQNAQRDIRSSQAALGQATTHSNNPEATRLMSQQASAGRSVVSQGPAALQGQTALQSADTRALADPNHLQQTHMAQQHIAAPIQTPQDLGTRTQPAMRDSRQPGQGGTAPILSPSAPANSSNLTQAALRAHTEKAQAFQNRRQQTAAALHQAGPPQTRAPAAGAQSPPTPPPVIPLAQFQTLPRERTQHKSPARGPEPFRHNAPAAQRHVQRPAGTRHPTATHHNHHPGKGHTHVGAHRHDHPRGQPAHFPQPRQQQAHRGRPRR
ncbi:uncharacterized protein si:dkeyp-97a10.3 isoform X2 [Cololabis saira]|nr:uncharacterized protein si:dkeyp-97a10.3 isoform X2 [Cololabis saira]